MNNISNDLGRPDLIQEIQTQRFIYPTLFCSSLVIGNVDVLPFFGCPVLSF